MSNDRRSRLSALVLCAAGSRLCLWMTSCFGGDYCSTALTVRGEVRDVETGEPIADAPIGGRTITDGLITGGGPAVGYNGEPIMAFTEADGTFALKLFRTFYDADIPEPCEFTMPDRVQIIIVHNGCEQRLMIAINEGTAEFFDREYPDDTLEFKDPILVPPCDVAP